MSSQVKKISWLRSLWLRLLSLFNSDEAPIAQPTATTPHIEVESPNIIVETPAPKVDAIAEPLPAHVAESIHILSRLDIDNMTAAEQKRHRKRLFRLYQSRHLHNSARG